MRSAFLTGGITLLLLAMLFWPEATYQGALSGLELWATTLVPALFPFMVIAEILLKIGVVPMLGVLLEPVMRPLFNLPGAASFVVAMGFTSGFPMGAVLTKRLCEEKQCTIAEGERLVAFTNNSSPLFILGAVAVGMFQYPLLGVLLAVAHYLANILIGILLGLKAPRPPQRHHLGQPLLRRSLQALLQAQKKRPPWAQMMRTAITNGVNNICLIGGFVIIFAILLKLLQVTSLQALFEYPCALFLAIIGLTPTAGMDAALATAFWEMTLGLKELSLATAPLREKAILASIILGWSGLSIQAQVTGVLAGSDISPRLYYRSRLLHSVLAGLLTYLLTFNQDRLSLPSAPALTLLAEPKAFFPLLLFNFGAACRLFIYSLGTLFALALLALGINQIHRKLH